MKQKGDGANQRKLCARLMAVQAVYQNTYNDKPSADLVREYLDQTSDDIVQECDSVSPDKALFSKIIQGVVERYDDLVALVDGRIQKNKRPETLIYAVLLCGAYELLEHGDIDKGIILNDYLNVGHGFLEKSEVSLINAILDGIAKDTR